MQTISRVVGSGFTTFNYRGKPIALLEQVQDSGQEPIRPPEAVMPLDAKHAKEFATARVLSPGTLRVFIREMWNAPVWHQLAGLDGTDTIIDVYEALARNPSEVMCSMVIKPPGASTWRGKTYHNCLVATIDDSETLSLDTLTIQKGFTIMYTHIERWSAPAGTVPGGGS